jgi:hypothetical protein
MVGKSVEPPSGEPNGESRARPDEQSSAGERVGVAAIARYRKDDGRALILYSRDEREDG